jgi:hypothetical protein
VNNEAPVLEILSPAAEAAVNGRVLVIGRVSDKIGLRSLSYDVGEGAQGTVALTPGDLYWAQELDLSGRKAGPVQASFTLENLAGVRRTARLRLQVDPESDRPQLTVASPQRGARLAGPVLVSGFVRDDDGVESVEYSLDGGAPVRLAASSAFDLVLENLPAGEHKLSFKAVDVGGVSGVPVLISFQCSGQPPRIGVDSLVAAAGSLPFSPGVLFTGDKDGRLSGTILYAGAALKAEYSLAGGSPKPLVLKKAEGGKWGFDLLLPRSLPAGRVDVAVRASDGSSSAEYRSFFFRTAEQGVAGIVLADARIGTDAPVRLEEGSPLVGYVAGGPLQAVSLEPPAKQVRVSSEGALFRVEAAEPGVSEPVRIQVTAADGSRLSSDPIVFATDLTPPSLEVQRPASGDWLASELRLEGSASDPGGLASLEYALDGGDFTAVAPAADASGRFAAALSLGALAEGPHLLTVRAADLAGNIAARQVAFQKDTTAPVLSLTVPRPEDPVNGLTSLIGSAEDAGRIVRIEVSEDGTSFREVSQGARFSVELNLSTLPADKLILRCTDAAGNAGQLRPQFNLNLAADKPVVQIQLPASGELLRSDFLISGMVFDDDGVAAIRYRLDGGEYRSLEAGNSFSIPVSLAEVGDNEHTVEVQAEDTGGLASDVAKSTFKASTSDPVSALVYPTISEHVRGMAELAGTSRDPNGIAEVRLSFDNGLSFFQAAGTEAWRYRLDTRLLADGTHAVLVQARDTTGAVGMYATTINIDNQPPELALDAPLDGQVCADVLKLDGRSRDNIGIASLAAIVTPVSPGQGAAPPSKAGSAGGPTSLEMPLEPKGVLLESMDLWQLPAGWYNLRVEARDQAGNRSYVSRNFLRQSSEEAERVDLFYPADGESLSGPFSVSGRLAAQPLAESVAVLLDGQPLGTAAVNAEGFFRLDQEAGAVAAGPHTLEVQAARKEEAPLSSGTRSFQYLASGPWVRIASFSPGDFANGRPFLKGEAGWFEGTEAAEEPAAKGAAGKPGGHKVRLVEVSLDNGRSFRKADGREAWRYRLETQELASGPLRLLVRAQFEDESLAVSRTQLTVDNQAPQVKLLEPSEGGRFNDSVQLIGTAGDESGLKEVAVSLRPGDKSRYQVPAFIQGLYLDLHAMGATYYDVGMGLTFFDDNVKLQVQIGMSPPGRFSGLVLGAKLLANVATLPFGYLFGPSWDFFSMSLAVGANFSYFTMSQDTMAFTDEGLVLGGMVAQLEFARFKIPGWRAASTYALYSEYQLWFISSDVEGGTESRIAFGLRIGLL